MTVSPHHTLSELERALKKERLPKSKLRLQSVVLAVKGHSAAEIGRLMGVEKRTVASWILRYNRKGLSSLQDSPRPGRPMRMSPEQLTRFWKRIEAGAQPEDGVCSLRGLDLQRILKQEFDVTYSLNGVYWLLHYLGYSSLVPRPQHCQTGFEDQEDFKKNRSRPEANGRTP